MNKILLSLLLSLACSYVCIGQATPLNSIQKDESTYNKLVERLRSGDTTVDFGAVRRAYVEWLNDGKGKKEAPGRDEMVKAFQSKDYAKAVQLGEIVADYEFVNDGLLGALADAYQKLGNSAKAKFYLENSQRSRHGLFLSGDGKTAKTAYFAMGVDEEYRVMRAFNYTVMMQSLMSVEGQSYDVLAGKDENGKSVELYFNICAFFPCSKSR